MDPFSAHIMAQSRSADYVREAAAERRAGLLRRRIRDNQTAPRPAPRPREVGRPVTA